MAFIDEKLDSIENLDTLRIYSYNNQRLSIEHAIIKYIGVNNEEDIRKDLLYSGLRLYTYMILEEDIKITNKASGYKNYKVITENGIEDGLEDILSDGYEIIDKTVVVTIMQSSTVTRISREHYFQI